MQNDPLVEWQRLTETYSKMYDDELLNLAADSEDLTEQARQVLCGEMQKRGLGEPQNVNAPRKIHEPMRERRATLLGNQGEVPGLVPSTLDADEQGDGPHEYTWKTPLRECETQEEARRLSEALKQAGIESWIEGPRTYTRHSAYDWRVTNTISNPRLMVAADQLEEARAIVAQTTPQEIVDVKETSVPEFELPTCPKCGAGDPVLEGVDPANSWKCEACGNEWTDSVGDLTGGPEKSEQ
jgi:hypothetical protein